MVAEIQNGKRIMETISKNQFIAEVQNLKAIVDSINTQNCYDKIVEFFTITSHLQDCSDEIRLLPLKGFKVWGKRSEKRRSAEIELENFLAQIHKAGRCSYGYNRTEPGETVTKDNLYFGDVHGIWTFTVRKFEDECKNDAYVQEHIRNQITGFVKSYKSSFNTDWLN